MDSGFETNNSAARVRRPGPVYVAAGGHVDLVYSSTVAHSYESGTIKQWVDAGILTVSMLRGATVVKSWLYDQAVQGGATSALVLTDPNGNALQIPAGTLALRGWVEVETSIGATGGAANVSIGVTSTAGAFRAATATGALGSGVLLPFNGTVVHNGTEAAAPVCHKFGTAIDVILTPDTNALTSGKLYVHIEMIASLI